MNLHLLRNNTVDVVTRPYVMRQLPLATDHWPLTIDDGMEVTDSADDYHRSVLQLLVKYWS